MTASVLYCCTFYGHLAQEAVVHKIYVRYKNYDFALCCKIRLLALRAIMSIITYRELVINEHVKNK